MYILKNLQKKGKKKKEVWLLRGQKERKQKIQVELGL